MDRDEVIGKLSWMKNRREAKEIKEPRGIAIVIDLNHQLGLFTTASIDQPEKNVWAHKEKNGYRKK